jgi:TolB protein
MKKIKFILSTLLIILLTTVNSFSLIEVDITRGNLNPLPVAVSPLSIDEKSKKVLRIYLIKKI